jgi:large subunit ribosomal protein L35
MPKLKSHKGASKRFKKTATGKVKRGHSGLRHMLSSKAKKRKRRLGTATLVSDGDLRKVKRMIPYQ